MVILVQRCVFYVFKKKMSFIGRVFRRLIQSDSYKYSICVVRSQAKEHYSSYNIALIICFSYYQICSGRHLVQLILFLLCHVTPSTSSSVRCVQPLSSCSLSSLLESAASAVSSIRHRLVMPIRSFITAAALTVTSATPSPLYAMLGTLHTYPFTYLQCTM